jgi:tetratricopeptide (TPR) repeat protein
MARTQVETRTYTLADAAAILGTSEARVLHLLDAGLPEHALSARRPGARFLAFQDLVLLRNAKRLVDQDVAPARVVDALRQLRAQLPEGTPPSAVRLEASAGDVVVLHGASRVLPRSGQVLLDLGEVARARGTDTRHPGAGNFEALFARAKQLEDSDPGQARALYAQLLARVPDHADAHVNLGRLLHEAGRLGEARTHYRIALALRPNDATAAYNLAVALGDEGRTAEAVTWYHAALEADPRLAEAHYNLARLHERRGQALLALRHFKEYRRLAG